LLPSHVQILKATQYAWPGFALLQLLLEKRDKRKLMRPSTFGFSRTEAKGESYGLLLVPVPH
jgi:hypothetical protein